MAHVSPLKTHKRARRPPKTGRHPSSRPKSSELKDSKIKSIPMETEAACGLPKEATGAKAQTCPIRTPKSTRRRSAKKRSRLGDVGG
jgi:hypothetical protein